MSGLTKNVWIDSLGLRANDFIKIWGVYKEQLCIVCIFLLTEITVNHLYLSIYMNIHPFVIVRVSSFVVKRESAGNFCFETWRNVMFNRACFRSFFHESCGMVICTMSKLLILLRRNLVTYYILLFIIVYIVRRLIVGLLSSKNFYSYFLQTFPRISTSISSNTNEFKYHPVNRNEH